MLLVYRIDCTVWSSFDNAQVAIEKDKSVQAGAQILSADPAGEKICADGATLADCGLGQNGAMCYLTVGRPGGDPSHVVAAPPRGATWMVRGRVAAPPRGAAWMVRGRVAAPPRGAARMVRGRVAARAARMVRGRVAAPPKFR